VPSHQELLDTLEGWRRFPGLERFEPGEGRWALTFDDGPDPDATPAVLDALDASGAKATFFLVGEQLLGHHELGGEVARRGHAVGLHGFHHEEHDRLPDVADDLRRGLDAVESATGTRPKIFRPPYGRPSEATAAACRDLGLELVYWSGWGMDWEPIPGERIADLVVRDLADGVVVVLHDSARYSYRDSAFPTAEALPPILEAATGRGLSPVALPG
jgi:peptidoglycan/xylan/chitin deacetylase (PgdA/CDA1 family)